MDLYWRDTSVKQSKVAQYLIRLAAWWDKLPLQVYYRVESNDYGKKNTLAVTGDEQ